MKAFLLNDQSLGALPDAIQAVIDINHWELAHLSWNSIPDHLYGHLSQRVVIFCLTITDDISTFLDWYRSQLSQPTYCKHHIVLSEHFDSTIAAELAQYSDIAYVIFNGDTHLLAQHLNNLCGCHNHMPEKLLSDMRSQFGQIIDHSSIISVTDKNGKILYANNRFCQISGYSREELLGQNHRLLRSTFHDEKFYITMWQTILSGEPWYGDVCNRTKYNSHYWVSASIYPVYCEKNDIQAFVSIRHDITAQIALQEMLKERDERFRTSHAYSRIGTWDWNLETDNFYCSAEVSQLFGFDIHRQTNTFEQFKTHIYPADLTILNNMLADAYASNGELNAEHRIVTANSGIRWVMSRGRIKFDQHGRAIRVVGITSDIHELKSAQEKAIDAEKLKSQFISMLSHEIRNPLNAIAGYNRLNQQSHNAQYNQKIDQIIKHVVGILEDVHLNSRLESGNITSAQTPVSVKQTFDEALAIISQVRNAIEITFNGDDYWVLADAKHLKQIIVNLLTNAIKYNKPDGSIRLECTPIHTEILRISVIDTGCGISSEKLPLIFKPFERLEWSNSEVDGLGLGLSICKQLAFTMNGEIGVESTLGEGSTFWLELTQCAPITTAKEKPLSVITNLAKRVLILEDNAFNQEFMRAQMRRLHIQCDVGSNGLEGLELLKIHTYDLILSDVNMPEMDGLEFIQRLRSSTLTQLQHIPVVLITAEYSLKNNKPKEADHVLIKPFTEQELLQALALKRDHSIDEEEKISTITNNIVTTETDNHHPEIIIQTNLLERYLGEDSQRKKRFLELYSSLLDKDLQEIEGASQQQDYQRIAYICHRLATSSLCIGANVIHDILRDICRHIRDDNSIEADELIQKLHSLAPELKQELHEHLTIEITTNALTTLDSTINIRAVINIVIIDDDELSNNQLLNSFEQIETTHAIAFSNARDALEFIKREKIDIIVFDINMPDIDGLQFIRLLSESYNDEALIIYSGEYSLVNPARELIQNYGMICIGSMPKPATPQEISRSLGIFQKINKDSFPGNYRLTDEELISYITPEHILVYFQPQICLKTNVITAVEALSRIVTNSGEILPPLYYIHRLSPLKLEQQYSLIVAAKAIAQLAAWQAQGHSLQVAINFSMLVLENLGLPEAIEEICSQHLVAPDKIVIEVTETELTTQPKHAVEVLSRLKLKGFILSIDDFGTGYSSLDKLKKLPFTEMKLDRSYVSTAKDDDISMALLVSSLGLAQTLGISSVAEGIETEEDLEIVTQLGAQKGQGYFFSKPVPAEELERLLETFNGKQ